VSTLRLRSERIVTPAGTVAGEVVVDGPAIAAVAPATPTAGGEIVELGDRWLLPGYIDAHVHGGGGAQCNTADPEDILAVARFHARHGTTSLLATTVSASVDALTTALTAIARAAAEQPAVLGAHLEGPFLSPHRPGAMDPGTFLDPDPAVLERLLTTADHTVRLMTIAPERPGAGRLIGDLVRQRVVASVGHSDATYDETRAAADAGARAATHLFNAMPPLHHREPGLTGAVLDLPAISCELICDGVHVDPAALRLAYRAKGPGGIRLVTDAMQAAGMPDGAYLLGTAPVEVVDGRATLPDGGSIAGSTLTMEDAVRNAVRFLGIDVAEASRLASRNPARLLGLADRKGAIAPGLDADLVVLDDDLRVRATLVAGTWAEASAEIDDA
jgi:N-acetylglucosamine-6-phosphate deacetylase